MPGFIMVTGVSLAYRATRRLPTVVQLLTRLVGDPCSTEKSADLGGGRGQPACADPLPGRASPRPGQYPASYAVGTRPGTSATTAGVSATSTGAMASAAALATSTCRRSRPSGSAGPSSRC